MPGRRERMAEEFEGRRNVLVVVVVKRIDGFSIDDCVSLKLTR